MLTRAPLKVMSQHGGKEDTMGGDLGMLYPKSSHSTNSYRVLIQMTFNSLPCDTQLGGVAVLPSGSERM